MRAEIITSGTELLLGDLVDTNAAYLSRQLRALGINVHYRTTVGDNEERMAAVVSLAMSRAELVITTGGLGPTVDDVTRQAIARATGRPLVLHPELLAAIEARFRSFGYRMTENNIQQAYIPEGAVVIENPVGTAPCFAVETPGGAIIALPGVPRELEYLMEHALIPYLRRRFGPHEIIKTRVLKTCAIGESAVDERIADLMQSPNPTVGLNAHPGQTDVRITAKAASEAEADRMLDDMETKLRERLGDSIYGTGTQTLEEVVLRLLEARGETMAVLETVTGGQLTQRLASVRDVAGFIGGIVASEQGLRAVLAGEDTGEGPSDLAQVASEDVRNRFRATYGLAVVAGHDGSLVSLIGPGGSECLSVKRPARDSLGRTWVATTALNMLRKHLLNSGRTE